MKSSSLMSNTFVRIILLNILIIVILVLILALLQEPLKISFSFYILRLYVPLLLLQLCLYYKTFLIDPLPSRWKPIGLLLFIVWTSLSMVALFIGEFLRAGNVMVELSFVCLLGNAWIMFLRVVLSAVRRLTGWKWSEVKESLMIIVGVLFLIAAANYEARLEYEVNRIEVNLGVEKPLSLTIISDTHFGPVLGLDFCQRIEKTVDELHSDFVFLVGDIFDSKLEKIPEMVSECVARFYNREGIYYVTGNHEHINRDVHSWISELKKSEIHVLENDCIAMPEYGIHIVGVNDLSAERFSSDMRADVSQAVSKCKTQEIKMKKIVLAHQPNHNRDFVEILGDEEFLMLSGHTHAGQIWPVNYLVYLGNDFFAGLYKKGKMNVFVSRGAGQWGPRLRLLARSEIVRIDVT